MVDATKGIGGASGISPVSAKDTVDRHHKTKDTDKKQKTDPQDEVVLSREALDRQQAEQVSRDTRKILENSSHSLAPSGSFADEG